MRRRAATLAWLMASAVALTLLAPAPARVGAGRALALLTSDSAAYKKSLSGFKAKFSGEVEVAYLEEGETRLSRRIKAYSPDLIFAVGSSSAELAAKTPGEVPVVYSMVYYPERHGLIDKDHVCGVSLAVPFGETLKALEAVAPKKRKPLTIGVMYSSGQGSEEVSRLEDALSSKGHELIARKVSSDRQVRKALSSLLGEVDVLWLVMDLSVLGDESYFRLMLKEALDRKVAVVGLSDSQVRKGALLSVSVDYRREGERAAGLAEKIVKGASPSDIGALAPENLVWSLNLKVAKELGWPVGTMTRKRFERVHQ